MKKPTELLGQVLLNEAFCTKLAVERDLRVIGDRFEHEGLSFLTITLPVLCDALEKGITIGRITPDLFPGFAPWKRGGRLPGLLRGFFMRVFDLDGWLLDVPCIDSIRAIRQVTRLFKKVELPCSSTRVKRAFERYHTNDQRVLKSDAWNQDDTVLLRSVAGFLWSDLEGLSGEFYCSPGVFGTGATAERKKLNERLSIDTWPERSEACFPSSYHASYNEGDVETFAGINYLSESDELPVRVVQVPKTLKTPRIISVEPSYMMLMQQSIAKLLMDYLEGESFPYKSIRFRDQSHNREMARIGSIDGSYATIDLSDASDLVGNDLVKTIFETCPTFLGFIQDCRSRRAQLPDGTLVTLNKFASQGSALCFPVESMCFFTIALASMVRESGRRLSSKLLAEIAAKISVYGDDIIVPAKAAAGVMDNLEAFGLRVNHSKSFTQGFFRESCGGDYYKGVDVTPTYVRHWDFTGNTLDAELMSSYVSLTNQLYWKGLWHAAQYVRSHLEGQVGRETIPLSSTGTGYLSFASVRYSGGRVRWNPDRCGFDVMAFGLHPQRQSDPAKDLRAVMLGSFQSSDHFSKRSSDWTAHWRNYPDGLPSGRMEGDLWRCFARSGSTAFSTSDSWRAERRERMKMLSPKFQTDLVESIKPYALKLKRRWHPM